MLHLHTHTYKIHRHSQSYRKYENDKCQFLSWCFFTDRAVIAQPLSNNLGPSEKKEILLKRKEHLSKEDIVKPKSINEILTDLSVPEETYNSALKISEDSDFQIYLRWAPNSCFVNNSFEVGLKAWYANMDMQPVLNKHKAISYMCAYLSKTVDGSSNANKKWNKLWENQYRKGKKTLSKCEQ